MRIAIQGEPGAFRPEAARALAGDALELVPCPTFDALFGAAVDGTAECALVPIENSLHGSIHENFDRLSASDLSIVGEAQLRIEQCLIARPGAVIGDLRRVASHPVALAQCRTFFAAHPGIEAVAAADTAGSVRALPGSDLTHGAIASRLAAELYGCEVLRAGIEDDRSNTTRFLLVAPAPRADPHADKASLIVTLENVPGALHRALGPFAARGVDLTKLESRPLRDRPFEYAFYLDVRGDPAGAAGAAVEELRAMARSLRVLGWYRAAVPLAR